MNCSKSMLAQKKKSRNHKTNLSLLPWETKYQKTLDSYFKKLPSIDQALSLKRQSQDNGVQNSSKKRKICSKEQYDENYTSDSALTPSLSTVTTPKKISENLRKILFQNLNTHKHCASLSNHDPPSPVNELNRSMTLTDAPQNISMIPESPEIKNKMESLVEWCIDTKQESPRKIDIDDCQEMKSPTIGCRSRTFVKCGSNRLLNFR